MTEIAHAPAPRPLARLGGFLAARREVISGYLAAISGSAGRLVFSLVYFVALANALSIAEFGLFATASAAGVMLSRIVGLGFIAALYRTATVRPRLIGTYTAGFLMMAVLSLPVLALAAVGVYLLFFAGLMAPAAFAAVVAAEALLWRPVEAVVIVNNGLGRFGRASTMVIFGTLLRAGAAASFMLWPSQVLADWTLFYLAANAVALILAVALFQPRQRLRLKTALYWRRLPDSLYVAGAEMLFYLQMELDKLLVLALGGPTLAGIYAIVMRLVDLTAIPIRTFSMMLVQKMMRTPDLLARMRLRLGLEAGVFAVSTAALACLAVILHFFPTILGRNVAEAAPLVALALAVPGLRNLVEYQAELLFARGQTGIRAVSLGLLAVAKAGLLAAVLAAFADTPMLVLSLNAVFAGLWLISSLVTHWALGRPAKPI